MNVESTQRRTILVAAMLALAALLAIWLLASPSGTAESGHGEQAAATEFERGPHRGRMLRDGDFAVEIAIFEEGVPPEFRVYAYQDGKPVAPNAVRLGMDLTRLGGHVDRFAFQPQGDFLRGQSTVHEPHSFDVKVAAQHGGKSHAWTYASYEGRTQISAEAAAAAGLVTETAGPATLQETVSAVGRIALNRDQSAQIEARFAGLVREVRKSVGDAVAAGEVLATVESNESLQPYTVRSPISGTVLSRSTNPGAVTGTAPIFEVADLSTVWAELNVFTRDAGRVTAGQAVLLQLPDGSEVEARIDRFHRVADPGSQSVIARIVLPNPEGKWRPGQAVTGRIVVATRDVPLAVKTTGLQRFRDFTVVFAQVGDTYEVRMLELGQRHGELIEVLGGLTPGERYVSDNSFLVKADIEKSGASHDH